MLTYPGGSAVTDNDLFDKEVMQFLRNWLREHRADMLLQFDQPLADYLANDALRDFFLTTRRPVQQLLKNESIAGHLARNDHFVYFDELTGEPLLASTEQRIYNLARRMDSEKMHIPFRSVHPKKQTESGDIAAVSTYPVGSDEIRYNSGNYFASRPANWHVFDENSKFCLAKSDGNLQVLFKRGYIEDRLKEIKALILEAQQTQFFVICSRHSQKEGHYGVSLVIMEPANPDFPKRVLICDTILKDLPQHPRWWNHFVEEYTAVFGEAIIEMLEDLSHPLQKVNITGDNPYRHDWDCPYYAASMASALADLVLADPELILNGSTVSIHQTMKDKMPDYYWPGQLIKDRPDIRQANLLKRWNSGRNVIEQLLVEISRNSAYEI